MRGVQNSKGLAHWSVTQAVQALSSGEAELYALLRGVVEALGAMATAEELGFDFKAAPRVGSDSSAARSVASLAPKPRYSTGGGLTSSLSHSPTRF